MRNNLFTVVFALVAIMFTSCSDKPVPVGEVPVEAQTFIKQYFPGQAITYAEKDWSWFSYQYEVTLVDGTHVEFDRNNVWHKMESLMKGVPVAAMPAPIANYLNNTYPGVVVRKIEKDGNNFDVELINEIELKLNQQGALIEMDD